MSGNAFGLTNVYTGLYCFNLPSVGGGGGREGGVGNATLTKEADITVFHYMEVSLPYVKPKGTKS